MGVDWSSRSIYGTTDYNIRKKLPIDIQELIEADKHYQLPETYRGLELFWSDGGFHGIGLEIDMNKKHEVKKKKVQRIFKELGLGKPKYCQYTSLSV